MGYSEVGYLPTPKQTTIKNNAILTKLIISIKKYMISWCKSIILFIKFVAGSWKVICHGLGASNIYCHQLKKELPYPIIVVIKRPNIPCCVTKKKKIKKLKKKKSLDSFQGLKALYTIKKNQIDATIEIIEPIDAIRFHSAKASG